MQPLVLHPGALAWPPKEQPYVKQATMARHVGSFVPVRNSANPTL
jgi:hypothetical protein